MILDEATVIENGHQQLSGEALVQRIEGKTVWGDYRHGFKYITVFNHDGTMEGKNNVGAHHFGEWFVDMKANTFTVKWDWGWDNTTSRAYVVNDDMQFYDSTTGQWRTSITRVEDGVLASLA